VRKLLRAAQVQRLKSRNKFFAKALGGVAGAGAIMSGSSALKNEPMKALDSAEKALAADPTSVPAQKLLGRAASALGLRETAVFAWETVRDLQPDSREHMLALGDAYVAAGRHGDAVKVADGLLKRNSVDADAQALLKQASVAHSIDRGNWQSASGSYRDKLKDESQAVSLEQASKVVTTGDMTRRLLAEAEARAARESGNLNHIRDAIQAHRELGNHAAALEWLHKGAHLSFLRRKVNGEVWLPAVVSYRGSARVGLIWTLRRSGTSEYSGYRKFTVDTAETFETGR
jgi:tetratricopeptide (TPR) repeat protein